MWTSFIGGPYALFAGQDASRALATFSMSDDVFRNEYDDLSDLSSMQMESVREWEMQFTGKLLVAQCSQWNFNLGVCTPYYRKMRV